MAYDQATGQLILFGGAGAPPASGGGTVYYLNDTWQLGEAPSITSAPSATFIAGTADSFTVTTAGVPSPGLTESGTLPGGVTFVDNHNGTATLSGTPQAGTGGAYSLTVAASNGIAPDATQSFTLTLNQAPTITSVSGATFTAGVAGTFTMTTGGYPVPSLTEIGALPAGLTFVDNHNGTATLSGIAHVGTQRAYVLTITASNGIGTNASQSFTLTVNKSPTNYVFLPFVADNCATCGQTSAALLALRR